MKALDYSRSFVTFFTTPEQGGNIARIQIDATSRVDSWGPNGQAGEFHLIAPCRSEQMYLDGQLFQMPNYEFCGIFASNELVLLRTHWTSDRESPEYAKPNVRFERIAIDLTPGHFEPLETDADVVQATLDNRRLVVRTELTDPTNGTRAVIDYPIKTMNVRQEPMSFQVDTGPLLVPRWDAADLALRCASTWRMSSTGNATELSSFSDDRMSWGRGATARSVLPTTPSCDSSQRATLFWARWCDRSPTHHRVVREVHGLGQNGDSRTRGRSVAWRIAMVIRSLWSLTGFRGSTGRSNELVSSGSHAPGLQSLHEDWAEARDRKGWGTDLHDVVASRVGFSVWAVKQAHCASSIAKTSAGPKCRLANHAPSISIGLPHEGHRCSRPLWAL
ncbi:MAG: hypothetical protein R2848_15850 [Thermomicrobiales bacterium]